MSTTSTISRALHKVPTWGWVIGGTLAATVLALLVWRSRAEAKPLQPGERRVLVVGDSLTVGYLPKLKTWLASDDVIGTGLGGAQVAAITKKAAEYYGQQPTHFVVLAGINDVSSGKSSSTIYKALEALWRAAKDATGAKVVAVLLTPCGGYPKCKAGTAFATTREQVNNLISSALGTGAPLDAVVDTSSLGDDNGKLLPEYSSGGLHMTSAGYQKLAELVAAGLP